MFVKVGSSRICNATPRVSNQPAASDFMSQLLKQRFFHCQGHRGLKMSTKTMSVIHLLQSVEPGIVKDSLRVAVRSLSIGNECMKSEQLTESAS